MRQVILLEAERVQEAGKSGWKTRSAQVILANLSDISTEYPVHDYGMRSER